MNRRQARHTITLNDKAFTLLRIKGRFGESYSQVILRIVDLAESTKKEKKSRLNDDTCDDNDTFDCSVKDKM